MSTKIIGIAAMVAVAVFVAAFFMRTPDTTPVADTSTQVATSGASDAASVPAATTSAQKPAPAPAATPGTTKQPAQTPAQTPTQTPAPAPTGYTLAQVATHASASSCWTAINGKVYDVTSWINQHPGGRGAILSLCGRDGSAAFNDQHGGQRRPESELATFYLAPLI